MRTGMIGSCILAAFFIAAPVTAQTINSPVITAPTAGQVLQGQVVVTGATDIPNFASAEVAFAYISDPTTTWFTIQTASEPTSNGALATWDTSSITDGDYVLRLRVNLQDGSSQDVTVAVRVRNYTVLLTPTPTVTATVPAVEIPTAVVMAPSETPTPAPLPPPTSLPPNPAAITTREIYSGFWRGALVVALLFGVMGIFLRLRRRR